MHRVTTSSSPTTWRPNSPASGTRSPRRSPRRAEQQAIWPQPPSGQRSVGQYNFGNWTSENGSDTASDYVYANPNTITYVETGYALLHHDPCAEVLNTSGAYVAPFETADAIALQNDVLQSDLEQNLTPVFNSPQAGAYPISAYSYLLMAEQSEIPSSKQAVEAQYVEFLACAGQEAAGKLGYSPLPLNLVQADFDAVGRITGTEPAAPTAANCPDPFITGAFNAGGAASSGPTITNTTVAGGGAAASPVAATGGQAGSGPGGGGGAAAASGGAVAAAAQSGRARPVGVARPPPQKSRSAQRPPRRQSPPRRGKHLERRCRRHRASCSASPALRSSSWWRRCCSSGFWRCRHSWVSPASAGPLRANRRLRGRPMGSRPMRRAVLASLCATFAAGLIPSAVSASQSSKLTHASDEVSAPAQTHDTITAPPTTCPAQYTCTTIPSSADSSGGVVDAGPTQNLGDTQWVYVNLYQFTPGTDVEIAYCTDTQSLSAGPPLCVSSGYVLSANPSPQYSTEILTDGTQSLSFQVLDIDSSNDPFQGQEPGDANVKGTFYCNAASPCSLDVIDSGVNGLGEKTASPDNTAQFPMTFAQPFSGCGGSAASVTTESEYGIEFLLPIASAAACSRPVPTLAFNTAQDGLGAVQSLATGSAGVAFTDNPESSEQQAVLTGGNYKLIPVALTANVVGYKAEQEQGGILYPVSSFDLTPTMAAGVLTGVYGTPQSADEVTCSESLGCPSFGGTVCTRKGKTTTCTPAPCPYHPTDQKKGEVGACSLFAELNFQQDFSIAQQYESFVRSDDAGSVGLAFDWLCHAPVVPVTVDIPESSGTPYVATYSDNMTAAQLIKDGFGTPTKPLTSCPNVDQYPPSPLGASVVYTGYEDPNEQDLKMLSYVEPGLQGGNPNAAFATMNWSEALYYGLQLASLQNGGGAFVTPSATTLDAAVNDATTNTDGTLDSRLLVRRSQRVPDDVGDLCRRVRGCRDNADRNEHLQHADATARRHRFVDDGHPSRGIRALDERVLPKPPSRRSPRTCWAVRPQTQINPAAQ